MKSRIRNCIICSCIFVFVSCQKQEFSDQHHPNTKSAVSKTFASSIGVAARPTAPATQNLIRLYNEWFLKRDVSEAPFDDATGNKQYAAQPMSSGTMMLASGFGPDLQERTVNISLSQYQKIFIGPLANIYLDTDCNDENSPSNGNIPYGIFKSSSAAAFNSHNASLAVTLDGTSIVPANIQDARDNSGFWEFNIHPSWTGCTDFSTMSYADGFFFLVPLTIGTHTFDMYASGYFPSYKENFSNHIIYTLNVTP